MLKSRNDIWHYLLGNYRYKLYCYRSSVTYINQVSPIDRYRITSSDKVRRFLGYILLRDHIIGQIEYRIKWMNQDCYNEGSCRLCGCETPHLQCANRSCEKPCYPTMMTASQWKQYINGSSYKDINGTWLAILSQNLKPILFKETAYGFQPQNSIIPEEVPTIFLQKEGETRSDHPTGEY